MSSKRKNRLKCTAALALIACMAAALPAWGEQADWGASAKGMVRCSDSVDVFAPVGGRLLPADWSVGDRVEPGEVVADIRPLELLAANDGVIRSLRAQTGDQASAVCAQYGALCYIDRTDAAWVRASTSKAHSNPDNRAIVIGETLRVYNGKESNPLSATGTVISIEDKQYIVEIPAGVFDLEDNVRLYRGEGGAYRSGDKVGEGEVERVPPIPVTGEGAIARIEVSEGQRISRGDALFALDAADAVHTEPARTDVLSARGGVVSALYATGGQRLEKDQLIMTVDPLDALEFVVEVDELDIAGVQAGMAVQVKVDALGGAMTPATVERIHPLGISVLDATKYRVTLNIQGAVSGLLPGMRVTAYWNPSSAPQGG
jgi:multidrug efflux pump subunit AcrA (membrane-fusion protein)